MNNRNCRKKKLSENKLFDLSKFEEWFALTYTPANCGGVKSAKDNVIQRTYSYS